jgi:uncharacterized protein (TIGR03435 family)
MRLTLFAAFACALGAQTPDSQVVFEVASIKPSPPPDPNGMTVGSVGGPGSRDPGRFTAENFSMFNLVTYAYGIMRYQVTGPDWLDTERFHIAAKVPEGATKEQFKLMLQNLLIERFKLAVHRDRKEMQVYELVIAKNGPKLTESAGELPDEPVAGATGAAPRMTFGKDRLPELPPGRVPRMVMTGRGARVRRVNESMEGLAKMLEGQIGRPVTDATGLKRKYDFDLAWSPRASALSAGRGDEPGLSDETGPTLLKAIEDQLGLKLELKKGSVEMLVIDHLERRPTEN